jgi:hypothetical protein
MRTEGLKTIDYTDAGGNIVWQLPVAAIAILAEYTTLNGPFLDDYFVVFASVENQEWIVRTATFYADGCDEVLEALSAHWGAPLQFGLSHSTDWNSRVIWPEELAGQDYFTFTEVPPQSLLERLRHFCVGKVFEYSPSSAVRGYINSGRRRPA